jgi:hypothetical protein
MLPGLGVTRNARLTDVAGSFGVALLTCTNPGGGGGPLGAEPGELGPAPEGGGAEPEPQPARRRRSESVRSRGTEIDLIMRAVLQERVHALVRVPGDPRER